MKRLTVNLVTIIIMWLVQFLVGPKTRFSHTKNIINLSTCINSYAYIIKSFFSKLLFKIFKFYLYNQHYFPKDF